MDPVRNQRSLGQLFSDLSQDSSLLIQHEIQLARAEITQKLSTAGKNAGFIAVGGFVAYAGFLTLLVAAVAGLAYVMPVWLAAVIVGVMVVLMGYVMLQTGLNALKKLNPTPQQTIETLKEDKEWLRHQLN